MSSWLGSTLFDNKICRGTLLYERADLGKVFRLRAYLDMVIVTEEILQIGWKFRELVYTWSCDIQQVLCRWGEEESQRFWQ